MKLLGQYSVPKQLPGQFVNAAFFDETTPQRMMIDFFVTYLFLLVLTSTMQGVNLCIMCELAIFMLIALSF